MEDRLDGKHCSHYCSCRRNTAAALEMMKIVNCKPVSHMISVCYYPIAHLFDGLTFITHLCSVVYEKALTERSRKSINCHNLSAGVLFSELFARDLTCIISTGKAGRECHIKHVVSCRNKGLESLSCLIQINCRGGCSFSFTELVVKILNIKLIAGDIFSSVYRYGERNDRDIKLTDKLGSKVRR
jgi:hypothetical protein